MARNQEVEPCPAGQWTQLTNADVTEITLQVLYGGDVYIRFTTDTTTPTEAQGALWKSGDGVLQAPITDLTYLSGAVRVWAKPVASGGSRKDDAAVYVDHP